MIYPETIWSFLDRHEWDWIPQLDLSHHRSQTNMHRWWLLLVFIIKYCHCGILVQERQLIDPDKFISQANLESSTCLTEKTIEVGLAFSTSGLKSGYWLWQWKFSCGSGFETDQGEISTLKAISDVTNEFACMRECEYHLDQGCQGKEYFNTPPFFLINNSQI